MNYRRFLDSNNPLAFALMAKMKYTRRQRVRLKADFLRLILRAGIDPARQSLLVEFVETYMPLAAAEQTQFMQLVQVDETYREVKQVVTTYELAGIKKGMEEGLERGREEGLREAQKMVTTYELAGIKKGREEGREEGMAKGIEKGIEKGMAKGKLEALLLLLENRFAKLPAAVRRKVERINSSQRIDELLLAVLTAKSLSELGL